MAQQEFHTWLRHKRTTSAADLDVRSVDAAAAHLVEVSQRSREKYHGKRDGGSAKKAEELAVKAGEFLKNFQPLVQFVQASEYGALAVGTLSAMFAITLAKSKTNDTISSALAGVKDRLPGFQMLEAVYAGGDDLQTKLKGKILLAYTGIIELAIQSAKYYLKSGFSRGWLAFWNPKKFDALAQKVQEYSKNVRLQSESLLTMRVDQILQSNHALEQSNYALEAKIKKLLEMGGNSQARDLDRNLAAFQDMLGSSNWTPELRNSRIQRYRQQLEIAGSQNSLYQWMTARNISQYKKDSPAFQRWEAHQVASLLLVSASSHEHAVDRRTCWMSPLALDIMESHCTMQEPHAVYIFDDMSRTSVHVVMCDILIQLLKWTQHHQRTTDAFSTLSATLGRYTALCPMDERIAAAAGTDSATRYKKASSESVKALTGAAVSVIKLFVPGCKVHIVVDRVDRCVDENQTDLIEILLAMMEAAACCVKVFAVANQLWWTADRSRLSTHCDSNFQQVTEIQTTRN